MLEQELPVRQIVQLTDLTRGRIYQLKRRWEELPAAERAKLRNEISEYAERAAWRTEEMFGDVIASRAQG